ncbi:MAG: DUF4402 domain-containing protein [Bacteroidales bacterium]|nr:DUF4402 domain-containing protein [Bacteroidales bacterium]
MKTTLKIFALTATLFGFATISFAQNEATASANAGAKVIEVIKLTKNVDLEFGNIVSGAGTVVIAPEAGVTRTGTEALIAISTADRTPTAAKFTVTGETGWKYSIAIPTESIDLEHVTDDSATMTVNAWALSSTHTAEHNVISGTATANEFYVGATLNANANQKAGVYHGSFDVTVTYE